MRFLILALLISLVGTAYSWNALGHRLVAEIAYQHLTKAAKKRFNCYNHALDKAYRPQSLVNSAAWLDTVRDPAQPWLGKIHYIDLPFSFDKTPLKPVDKINAVVAINSAEEVLQGQYSDFDKGISLRILLHVVGDIHQPLHASTLFSKRFRRSDKGGNLFFLKANPIANNLHHYWDNGGGLLISNKKYNASLLAKRAQSIEKRWPCKPQQMTLNPMKWAQESHRIAIHQAYQKISPGQKPTKAYQRQVKAITEHQIALAGCRLAALLEQID